MKQHITSPSSLETFARCPKQWYAEKVLKISQPPKSFLAFGTAMHEVCERFLLADDLGRTEGGDPVDLYPEEWHIIKERNGGVVVLSNEQQNLIKILFNKAIEEGYITRWADRKIERKFGFSGQPPIELVPGINICGVIDVDLPLSVRDWKTAKNMRYAKSAKALQSNWQMGIYAKVKMLDHQNAGGAIPDAIDVYHTVFSKDPDNQVIRETKATLTSDMIERIWEEIVQVAKQMKVVLERDSFWQAGEPMAGACGAYGGCHMLPVCNGGVSLENHKAQIELVLRNYVGQGVQQPIQQTTQPLTTPTPNPMGILSNASGATQPQPGIIPPAAAVPAGLNPPPAQTQVTVPNIPPAGNSAPWAFSGCTACGESPHPGLNTEGNPCRICDGNQGQAGGVTSGMYQITPDGEGGVSYQVRDQFQAMLQGMGTPLSGIVYKTIAAPVAQVQEAPVPVPTVPVTEPVAAPSPATEVPKKEKASVSFVLYINVVSTKFLSSRKVVDLNTIFGKYAEMLAAEKQIESFYKLEVWGRRDAMAAALGFIIEKEFPTNALVIAAATDPDISSFISALRPLASEVVEAKVV